MIKFFGLLVLVTVGVYSNTVFCACTLQPTMPQTNTTTNPPTTATTTTSSSTTTQNVTLIRINAKVNITKPPELVAAILISDELRTPVQVQLVEAKKAQVKQQIESRTGITITDIELYAYTSSKKRAITNKNPATPVEAEIYAIVNSNVNLDALRVVIEKIDDMDNVSVMDQ